MKRAVAKPYGFGRPGRARCDEHDSQLVDISGRIVRPRRCFAIQAIGFDISDRMFGFVGNRRDGFDKANQCIQFGRGQPGIQQNRNSPARPDRQQVRDKRRAAAMTDRHRASRLNAEIAQLSNPSIDLRDKAAAIPRDRQRQVMDRAAEVKGPAHTREMWGRKVVKV